MYKFVLAILICIFSIRGAQAEATAYLHKFDVKMDMDLSDLTKYISNHNKAGQRYDKGYISRFNMGKKFKTEFSRVIKYYGMSESRIKSSYEDELLSMINMLPKEAYPYIGPMLHEVPGMSEKILNLPGIKETKNKFPDEIKENYKGIEDIEFLSPALYVVLMPDFWKKDKKNLDKPEEVPAQKPRKKAKLPDYLLDKSDLPQPQAEKKSGSAAVKIKDAAIKPAGRTLYPTLASPLTTKDAEAFLDTIDDVVNWGNKNKMKNAHAIIKAGFLLDSIEKAQGTALIQNGLKDIVNPCQRLVLKTRIAGLYHDFSKVVAAKGFSPEEWAYTCDKTIKALRVAEANHSTAYAVQFHRRGYYNKYIEMLPEKWREAMFESEAAIIAMHSVFYENIEAVKPIKNTIRQKFNQIGGKLLLEPIIY